VAFRLGLVVLLLLLRGLAAHAMTDRQASEHGSQASSSDPFDAEGDAGDDDFCQSPAVVLTSPIPARLRHTDRTSIRNAQCAPTGLFRPPRYLFV
jgi:hypothetical protein